MKKYFIALIVVLLLGLFISCEKDNDFSDLNWKQNIPKECVFGEHISRIFGETQKDSKAKDFTFLKWASAPCFKALKALRCQIENYGLDDNGNPMPVDINNIIRHKNYLQCLR